MRVAIRADGSTEMGYGHLTRSNAVASELLDQGDSVTYLTSTPDAASSICADRVGVLPLDNGTQDEVVSKLRDLDPDVTYMDLPEAPFKRQRNIREVSPLAVFLGSARHRLCCDILINGHFFAEEEEYEWAGEGPILCLGPDFLPLRPPFPEIATREKDCSGVPERALILMGGTDPHNITPTVMDAFGPVDIPVTVVVGPGNENYAEIQRKQESLSGEFQIERDPSDLAERMFNADIAVSGFGTTTYELMASQTPFIGVARNEFERMTASRVADYVDVDYFESGFSERQLTASIEDLQRDSRRRAQLQDQYEELVDGKGAKRIAQKLPSVVS